MHQECGDKKCRLTEGLSDLAAPVPPGNDRLVRDEGLLANDLTPLALVGARARDGDNWSSCKTAILVLVWLIVYETTLS
jgi:hypothetical protein